MKLEQQSATSSLKRRLAKPLTIYSLVALFIMLPLLLPGYIFALDMAFTPHLRLPEHATSSYPFYAVLHLLNYIVPSQILQKLMLFLILLLSGYGMHRLLSHLQNDKQPLAGPSMWGAYTAGLFYMINPFTYSRFMVGQFAVLLGYALLPFFTIALLDFYKRPKQRTAYIVAGWAIAVGIVSIHTLGLLAVLLVSSAPLLLYRYRNNVTHIVHIAKYGLLSLLAIIIASSYWLVPLATGKGTTAAAISGFTAGDQQAFATVGSSIVSKVANVLQLQGFWADTHSLYKLPQNQLPIWGIIILLVWALGIIGVISMARRGQRFVLGIITLASLSAIILACTDLAATLSQHIPLLAGYREPQKFIALLALAFAICIGMGVEAILLRLRQRNLETHFGMSVICFLLLPLLLTPTMLWGFSGQLKASNYPPDWTAMNKQLRHDHSTSRVLFVPWHQYMSFSFTDRVAVNPAEQFFDKPTIVSNDLEFGNASPTVPDPKKSAFTSYLEQADKGGTKLASQLARHDIEYLLLSKDNDYKAYDYLDKLDDLQMIQDTSTLRLYHNLAYGSDDDK